jgi:hypothetical protein
MLETWIFDWDPIKMFYMPNNNIPNSKSLDTKYSDEATLKGWVDPNINDTKMLTDVAIMDWTMLVIWLEIPGGRIPQDMFSNMGVAGAPNLDTS